MPYKDAYAESGGDWLLPKDRGAGSLPSLTTAPISAAPSSSGGGFLSSLSSPSSILGGLGGGGGGGMGGLGGGGMPSFDLSVAPSSSASVGPTSVSFAANPNFYSPFAVGSGASATADGSGAGGLSGLGDVRQLMIFAGVGLSLIFALSLIRK